MKIKCGGNTYDVIKFSLFDLLKLLFGFNLKVPGTLMNLWCIPEAYFTRDKHAFQILYRRYLKVKNE